jgi:hypothetical protein
MTLLVIILISFLILLIFYFLLIRPWQLHWGATKEEIKLDLPGDKLVSVTNFNATRGITITTVPNVIWRWIIQIGSKRAGWYSIDLIDNGGIKSATKILPQFQQIEVGQFIPFTPDQKNGMWVKEFKENEYILWINKDGKATWLWYLKPISNTETRLLTRLRSKYNWKGFWIVYYIIADFGDIIMMSKCMKGIKKRAEQETKTHLNNSN